MELDDPIVVYIADSNTEAIMIQNFLRDRAVDAVAIEDISRIGETLYGQTSLHRPKVYVGSRDKDKAHEFLIEFEERKIDRAKALNEEGPITVACESCGQSTEFAATLRGSVEDCPHCGEFLDVGEVEEWDVGEPE